MSQTRGVNGQVQQRAAEVPGVRSASFSLFTFQMGAWTSGAYANGRAALPESHRDIHNNVVGPAFFATMGLPVTLGILYMHAARAGGMSASGLNTQGHFLVRIGLRHDDLMRRRLVRERHEEILSDNLEVREASALARHGNREDTSADRPARRA